MSWLNPPIEKVIERAGNKYILCSLVSKRAKELLLEKAKVALVPGAGFGAEGYVRWSYATSMENIKKGMSADDTH